jgi:hypothetical protein
VGIHLRGGDALVAHQRVNVHPSHRHTATPNPAPCCRLVYHRVNAGWASSPRCAPR